MRGLSEAAEAIGYKTLGIRIKPDTLDEIPLPAVCHWQQNHFVVLYKVTKDTLYVADPGHGRLKFSKKEFVENWIYTHSGDADREEGFILLLEPSNLEKYDGTEREKLGWGFIRKYFLRYKKLLWQLGAGLTAGTLVQLSFPFLTQGIVDIGIRNQDISFVILILFAQLFLFLGKTSLEVIRSWILLHLSTRINVSLVSDFFMKMMRLPISFFDSKVTGDILQRIQDHERVERLLTSTSLGVLFSSVNLLIFGAVLAWYNMGIFGIFMIGSIIYFTWIGLFLKKRRELDFRLFSSMSEEQSKVIELIEGMQEIKLHNAERQKRWSWENIQAKLFKVNMKNLALEQRQAVGANFINELKNILITVLAAKLVLDGQITLGMMLAISYILGQLNGPLHQFIDFIFSVQDAKIALERLGEIHLQEDEEKHPDSIQLLDHFQSLHLENLSFSYPGGNSQILKNIEVSIPQGQTTAIVGASGSGKTTLMKLLLGFYKPSQGQVVYGNTDLQHIKQSEWRDRCGVVMQDGFIFNDSIANNIALGEDKVDFDKLRQAAKMAEIHQFISQLPRGYSTKIGTEGLGLSMGQRQRILIARAIYKDPELIFFDEATSALDAKNERAIVENLSQFIAGRTAVIIAHRLSTVRNADQILVLHEGHIVEQGTHDDLVTQMGAYFELVRNQLELESIHA